MSTFCARCGIVPVQSNVLCSTCFANQFSSPTPPAPRPRTVTEERWGWMFGPKETGAVCVLDRGVTEESLRRWYPREAIPVRVTLTYTVPEGFDEAR